MKDVHLNAAENLPAIELRDVSFSVGSKTILESVSLNIMPGESIAIVGESGAGKTTLGRILLGISNPTTGTYRHHGDDVFKLHGSAQKKWRTGCQAVFQNPTASLNPRMSIERAITEPIGALQRLTKDARRSQARDLLEMVGLSPDLADRRPHQLSGGQRQRVIIARSISTNPAILILDEPVSGLDVSARAQVLNVLSDLKRQLDLTIVYITHDLATVGYLCDRVAVLYAGKIVEDLSVNQMHTQVDHPYTGALLSAVIAPDKAATYSGRVEHALGQEPKCDFAISCPHVQPRCVAEAPELIDLGEKWISRCHFAGTPKPPADLAIISEILT